MRNPNVREPDPIEPGTRTVDVHIRWLREMIEARPSQPVHLLTVRGLGYRFIA